MKQITQVFLEGKSPTLNIPLCSSLIQFCKIEFVFSKCLLEDSEVALKKCSHENSYENFRNTYRETFELESNFCKVLSTRPYTTLQVSLSTVDISVKISKIWRRCIFQDIVRWLLLKTIKKHETANAKAADRINSETVNSRKISSETVFG